MALFISEIREDSKSSGILSIQMTYRSYAFSASAISVLNVSTVTRAILRHLQAEVKPKVTVKSVDSIFKKLTCEAGAGIQFVAADVRRFKPLRMYGLRLLTWTATSFHGESRSIFQVFSGCRVYRNRS